MLPIYPKELDNDSEGENDPKWLQAKTMMLIDDFTDVNEGEKELMKLWNLHVMKHGYVGDCQIPLACAMFLESKGKELLMKNLYRNFILHMCNLFDFNLISPVALYSTIQKLQALLKEEGELDSDICKVLKKSHTDQVSHWVKTGGDNPPELKAEKTSKINFNNENANLNARRKVNLPMTSPPSVTNKTGSMHNGLSKPSTANKNPVNSQFNGETPPRRKSFNTVGTSGTDNSPPIRRKSMVTEHMDRRNSCTAMPNSSSANTKTAQLNKLD